MSIPINPAVESLAAYVPGEQPKQPGFVKLNTNENPYPAATQVRAAIEQELAESVLQKYPEPFSSDLRQAVAHDLKLAPEEVLVGNGSDEVLRLICHAFVRPGSGDEIGMLNPTYVLYETLASMFGAASRTFDVVPETYEIPSAAIDSHVKIFFLPNPNPPIGTYYSTDTLKQLAAANPERMVVIDEAYVDFAPGSALEVYREFPNVAITRTFSKSYSLAGMRVGFVIARPELIGQLDKIRDSYNVNRISQAAALAAWNACDYHRECCDRIVHDRDYLTKELRHRGFTVPQSYGNFVFARRPDAKDLYQSLKQRRMLVRYFSTPALADGIRITVGTRQELDTLLQLLDELGNS